MPDVTVQDLRIHVKDSGYGKPIVFIHGHPDTADLWDDVIQHMPREGYRYIRPDIPGYGQSAAGKPFNLSINNRGKWIADLLDALGVHEPVVVVGHDHGGVFAASYAIQYEKDISHLVMINTCFHNDYNWHIFGAIWRIPILGEMFALISKYRFTVPMMKWYMRRAEPSLTDEYLDELYTKMTAKMGRQMLRLYRASTPTDIGDREYKFHDYISRKPTLVLWGEKDVYVPLKFAVRMNTQGAQLATFPDVGHWPMITKPEDVARKIIRFIETS